MDSIYKNDEAPPRIEIEYQSNPSISGARQSNPSSSGTLEVEDLQENIDHDEVDDEEDDQPSLKKKSKTAKVRKSKRDIAHWQV